MNSSEIYALLIRISATSGKKEKEALIASKSHEPEFRKVLRYAYDPAKVFFMASVPYPVAPNVPDGNFTLYTWRLLDLLAERKLTGQAAIDSVKEELSLLNLQSRALLEWIIKKDLRSGFSASTINKAIPGLINVYPYMRCSLPKDVDLSKFDWKTGVISQEKADGMFANINLSDDGSVAITSRQGSRFPDSSFKNLISEVQKRLLRGFQYHGELLVTSYGGVLPREQSNGVLNSVLKGGSFEIYQAPTYQVWDAIPLDYVKEKGKYLDPYRMRLARIIAPLRSNKGDFISLIPTRVCRSIEEAYKHYGELLAKGKEGTIIKDPRGIWRDGTSRECAKLKLEVDVDLIAVDLLPGEGKNESTFGSVLCRTSDGLLEVAVSGFTDAERAMIHQNWDICYRGSIMTARANSVMKPLKIGDKYSLFLPRCVEFREDKTEADSLQRVIDQFESAAKGEVATKKAA